VQLGGTRRDSALPGGILGERVVGGLLFLVCFDEMWLYALRLLAVSKVLGEPHGTWHGSCFYRVPGRDGGKDGSGLRCEYLLEN
jgi:hypothetical protein